MIDALVLSILLLLGGVVLVWVLASRVRTSAERPKHEMLERILRFEQQHPRRDVPDPHKKNNE
jgi:hypothetical protein